MKTLLQINSVINTGSTGRIAESGNGVLKIKKINGKRLKSENFDYNNFFNLFLLKQMIADSVCIL